MAVDNPDTVATNTPYLPSEFLTWGGDKVEADKPVDRRPDQFNVVHAKPLSPLTDRFFFSFAPVYNSVHVNFSLVEQFFADMNKDSVEEGYKIHQLTNSWAPVLAENGETLESLPLAYYEPLLQWSAVPVFGWSSKEYRYNCSMRAFNVEILDPNFSGVVTSKAPLIRVLLFTPSVNLEAEPNTVNIVTPYLSDNRTDVRFKMEVVTR